MTLVRVVGRLRPGASLETARGELQAIRQRAESAALAMVTAAPEGSRSRSGRAGTGPEWWDADQGPLGMAVVGVAIGLPVAFGLSRFLKSALYGIAPSDPLTYLAIPVVLLSAAFLAAYLPARRATRVEPVVALRQD